MLAAALDDPPGGDVERDERLVEVAVAVVRDAGAQRGRRDHEPHGGRVGPGGLAQGVEDVGEVARRPAGVVQVPPGVGALQRQRGAAQVAGLRLAQGGREQADGGVGLLELERGVDRGVEPGGLHGQVAVERQRDGPDERGAAAVPAVGQAGDAFEHLATTRPRDPGADGLGVQRVREVDRDVALARDRQPRGQGHQPDAGQLLDDRPGHHVEQDAQRDGADEGRDLQGDARVPAEPGHVVRDDVEEPPARASRHPTHTHTLALLLERAAQPVGAPPRPGGTRCRPVSDQTRRTVSGRRARRARRRATAAPRRA